VKVNFSWRIGWRCSRGLDAFCVQNVSSLLFQIRCLGPGHSRPVLIGHNSLDPLDHHKRKAMSSAKMQQSFSSHRIVDGGKGGKWRVWLLNNADQFSKQCQRAQF